MTTKITEHTSGYTVLKVTPVPAHFLVEYEFIWDGVVEDKGVVPFPRHPGPGDVDFAIVAKRNWEEKLHPPYDPSTKTESDDEANLR